jgi:crotonobetainyl-CoA:carnitine CoA-transferase CaiB-like acyl-CoA transferase
MLLAGIRVVEIGQIIAGPFAGVIFADLGADVIKVEKPNGGDDLRTTGAAFRDDDSLSFCELNRNKRSVTIDFKSPDGMERFLALVATADILIHNQRPDMVKTFGIDAATLRAKFPRLIYCQISAFGHAGPMELAPGYEPLVQAHSGLSSVNGFPDRPPVRTGPSVCDLGTGTWTVLGALAALRRRDQTGEGALVNTSLFETALGLVHSHVNAFVNMGTEPKRLGTGHPNMVPYQTFDAADASFVICAGNDRLFAKTVRALGHPEWAADPRYVTNRLRVRNRDALIAAMAAVIATGTREDWIDRLTPEGVPCTPVNTVPDAIGGAQAAALGILQSVPGTDTKLVGLPMSIDGVRPGFRKEAPRLGEDNTLLDGGRTEP